MLSISPAVRRQTDIGLPSYNRLLFFIQAIPVGGAQTSQGTQAACTSTGGPCPVTSLDLFRWAISEQEVGIFGYTPGTNPCDSSNAYCAAQTGNPATPMADPSGGTAAGCGSGGTLTQSCLYAASTYGRTQISLGLLASFVDNPGSATLPSCLKAFGPPAKPSTTTPHAYSGP